MGSRNLGFRFLDLGDGRFGRHEEGGNARGVENGRFDLFLREFARGVEKRELFDFLVRRKEVSFDEVGEGFERVGGGRLSVARKARSVGDLKKRLLRRLGGEEAGQEGEFYSRFVRFGRTRRSEGSRDAYRQTLRRMEAFDADLRLRSFEEIDRRWLLDFDAFMARTAPSANARAFHMRNIRAVFNDALDDEAISCYPFRRFKIRREATRKRALAVEQLRLLASYPCEEWQEPYRDLFASMDAIKQEVILARDYDATKAVKHEANYYTMSTTYGRPGMNKKIVNSYLMKDGSRFTDIPGYDEMQYYDEMQNRDPRLTQTVVGPGYMRINSDAVMSPDFTASTTGYQIIKWVTDASGDGYLGSSNDYILFRAAEVYLNFAEAKAELGTLTQADLDKSIKKIRDRVGMPNIDLAAANANPDPYLTAENSGYHNVTGANKGVILEIRRERTIELILEGFRYYDLMRWKEGKMLEQPFMGMYFPGLTEGSGEDRYGIFDMNDGTLQDGDKVDICIYTGKKPSVKNIRKFYKLDEVFTLTGGDNGNIICHDIAVEPREFNEERDYLYPIPTTERSLTNGALTQNPGWDDGLSF